VRPFREASAPLRRSALCRDHLPSDPMSVKVRMQRHGAKKRPYYRIVVADSHSPRDGKFLELVGTYDPSRSPALLDIKLDRVEHWIGLGAQPSDTVRTLINRLKRGLTQTRAERDASQKEALQAARKATYENAKAVEAPSMSASE